MNETILGKLTNVKFGIVDGRFGLFYTLEGAACCASNNTTWDPTTVDRDAYTQWTEQDRDIALTSICKKVSQLLHQAKVDDITKLNNIPVQFTFKNSLLTEWRILTEVL